MGYDGKIVFRTKIDNSQVDKDLKQCEKKILQAEESISKNENAKLPLVNQAKELGAKLDAAKANAHMLREELAAINNAMAPGSAPDDYAAASANLPKVQASLRALEKEVATLQKQWDSVNNKIDAYDVKIKAARDSIATNTAKAAELSAQMNSYGAKMQQAFDKARTSAEKFRKKILAVGASMIMFRVFSAVMQGISNYMGKILKTNEEYTAQLAQLRAALMTAFQPIYEFVLPGLMAVLKALTSIVMVVANVISALGGKSLTQNAKNAKALNEQADALENVGGAAKDAGKSLANFDEINTLSTGESGGGGASGAVGKYDFEEFDTAEYKAKIDELTVYLSGALLAIGAILAFSGANIPLGIALMAAGALGMVTVIKENWGKMSDELKGAIAKIMFVLGGALLVIGAVLAFSGAKVALGIALMAAGAMTMASVVALNWAAVANMLKNPIALVTAIVSAALLALGAVLAFSGANLRLGVALMAAGAIGLVAVAALNWGTVSNTLKGPIGAVVAVVSGALLALGAILAFSGKNVPLGIALMAAGAIGLATVTMLNWETIKSKLQGPVGVVVALVSGALLALGAVLAFSGINLTLGIALMAAGAVGLVTVGVANWETVKTTLEGPIGTVVALASGALLALGVILAFSGINLPLGIALIAAGAVGLATVAAVNWDYVKDKLAEAWDAIKLWYQENVAPVLTLRWWTNAFSNIGTAISGAFEGAINSVTQMWNDFVEGVNQSAFISWRTQYLEGKKLIDAGAIQFASMTPLPFLAQGAVLPANKPFLAMVGDQKNGTNIEAPLDTIKQALAEVMAMYGGNGDTIIRFEGDLAQLARVLKPVIDRENNRVGGSLAKGGL